MRSLIVIIPLLTITITLGEIVPKPDTFSYALNSDEDITSYEDTKLNDLVTEEEKKLEKNKSSEVMRLSPRYVKCLVMSIKLPSYDYCPREAVLMKKILKEVVTNSCKRCPQELKVKAGRVMASLMQYHPSVWKYFTVTIPEGGSTIFRP